MNLTDEEKRSNYLLNRPRTVKNGVRLVENKIGNPSNIFSKEWIETFETLESGNRIAQGKLLAKKGQVMYIKVQKGFLVSKVQDARFKPYKIRIEVNLFTDQQWLKIIEALSLKAIYLAYMLNGKLHDDFLSIFSNEDFSLIPKIKNDLKAACTCSDWANPCKHTAAVFYALANEINTDPFILLKLRGKSKNEFIEILKEKRLS
ncbi:MAG: hypothetical protein FK734_11540, partial [Asgard group archaeon]|nr:hypothetical protein [Asgard group archaeon]